MELVTLGSCWLTNGYVAPFLAARFWPFHYLLAILPEDGEGTCSQHFIPVMLIKRGGKKRLNCDGWLCVFYYLFQPGRGWKYFSSGYTF